MLQDLLGTQLDLPVRVAIAAVVIAVLLGLTVLIVRRLSGGAAGPGGRSRQARLAVLDSVPVDQRRRLVLVRRDEVEHLLLVGGTSDLVVEPGIQRAPREPQQVRDGAARETTVRDTLPRRPASPAIPVPPDPATGRLAAPAKAELLGRPDGQAKPAIPASVEPVKSEVEPLSFEPKSEPEAEVPAPAPAPTETRRPFSFRRPEGETTTPRSFSRPALPERPARPAPAFPSVRLPTAKPVAPAPEMVEPEVVKTAAVPSEEIASAPAIAPAPAPETEKTDAVAETPVSAEAIEEPKEAEPVTDAAPEVVAEPEKVEPVFEAPSMPEVAAAPAETATEEPEISAPVVEKPATESKPEPVTAETTLPESPLPEAPVLSEPEPKFEAPVVEAVRFEPPVFEVTAPAVDVPEVTPPSTETVADVPAVEPQAAKDEVEPMAAPAVVPEPLVASEPPRAAPLFRRVPMFNVTRTPRETPAPERAEPRVDDLAKRLETSLESALGEPAAPVPEPVVPPPPAAAPQAPAAAERPFRVAPARFAPVMRAGAAPGTPFTPPSFTPPARPPMTPPSAPPAREVPADGLNLEQDLVRQLELTLAAEAEQDAKAKDAAKAESGEKSAIDPFDDLEAEMATLLGRNLTPRG